MCLSPQSHVEGGLPWTEEEEVVGEAVVLRTFQLTGARAASVGGCRVKAGRLLRSATYRLVRDGEVHVYMRTAHSAAYSGPLPEGHAVIPAGGPRGLPIGHEAGQDERE